MLSSSSPRGDVSIEANHIISGTTLKDVWELSIVGLLGAQDTLLTGSDTAGDFIDWQAITLVCNDPTALPQISEYYPYPSLIAEYSNQLLSTSRRIGDFGSISERIYNWPLPDGKHLNQYDRVVELLEGDPGSRRALITIWDPFADLSPEADAPISHCFLHFSIRATSLNLTVVSRSVDAMMGAVPNMIAFTALQTQMAVRLGVAVGRYRQFVFSYHMYVISVPHVQRLMDRVMGQGE